MIHTEYITQPEGGIDYLQLFRRAGNHSTFNLLRAAVAYATMGGVRSFVSVMQDTDRQRWQDMTKRWIVGIDWYRSEPLALERLAALPNSSVRVPDGRDIVGRRGCTPRLPFHPKTFLLSGDASLAVINGSGNLSRNGLTRGHECGSLLLFQQPLADPEQVLFDSVQNVEPWFEAFWNRSDDLATVSDAYRVHYESVEHMRAPAPTEEDSAPTDRTRSTTTGRRAMTPELLRKLRAARHFWIEAGILSKNRGPRQPGNQLMMSPMTRVFFGFEARDVPTDTTLGEVAVEFGGVTRPDCSLRFSNNSMDVLTLPVPGAGGPNSWNT